MAERDDHVNSSIAEGGVLIGLPRYITAHAATGEVQLLRWKPGDINTAWGEAGGGVVARNLLRRKGSNV